MTIKFRLKQIVLLISLLFCSNAQASPYPHTTQEYTSHIDGHTDVYALVKPKQEIQPKEGITLVVYLHGMGDDYWEPFLFPNGAPVIDAIKSKFPNIVFISTNYGGKAEWGNDGSLSDISANIAEINKQQPIKSIVMMGSSMGGCTALLYTAVAPPQIKKRIIGVVAVESSGDLVELYRITGYAEVRPAMEGAFDGTPQENPDIYRQKSFLRNLTTLNSGTKFFLVSARQDHTVPPRLQKEVFYALKNRGFPVKLIDVDGAHGVPQASAYVEGLDFVLGSH